MILDEDIEGYRVPLCRALTTDITIMGIGREMFILNVTFAVVFIMGLELWYLSPIFLVTHFLLKKVSEKDTKVLKIYMQSYSKQKQYYNE